MRTNLVMNSTFGCAIVPAIWRDHTTCRVSTLECGNPQEIWGPHVDQDLRPSPTLVLHCKLLQGQGKARYFYILSTPTTPYQFKICLKYHTGSIFFLPAVFVSTRWVLYNRGAHILLILSTALALFWVYEIKQLVAFNLRTYHAYIHIVKGNNSIDIVRKRTKKGRT